MTEIPEHLLKRSRDRRAALGLGGGEEAGEAAATPEATPATTTPAQAQPAAPAGPAPRKAAAEVAAPPPPPPDPPYVAAARSRPKIPFFAMAALSLMPIWVFMYVRALTEPPEEPSGPLGIGAEVYSGCVSCHGTQGEGGPGRPFADGQVLATFPNIEDQLRFVYFGSDEYSLAGVESYGSPDREGGANTVYSWNGQPMPQQGSTVGGSLTDEEILAVVCHERFTLGGANPEDEEYLEEYETWCSEEAPAFLALEAGGELATLEDGLADAEGAPIEIIPIGSVPAEGSPPRE